MTYFSKGIEQTQRKRDLLALRLKSVRSSPSEPMNGMTRDEAITLLVQDIADHDDILVRLRRQNES